MTNTITKIGRGLDRLEQEKSEGVPRSTLARFAQGPKTPSELIHLASDADLKHSAFAKRIDTLKNDVAKRAEQINADMDRLVDLPRHQRTALAAKELARFRREVREKTDKEDENRSAVSSLRRIRALSPI